MKRYKNISSFTLAIDCLSHTHYMRPGEIAALPLTRDVRHYARLNKIYLVREKKEVLLTEKPQILEKQEKPASFSKKDKQDKSSKKTEKLIEEMENE